MGFHFPAALLQGGKYPEVETYADLPPTDEFVGEIVVVATTTGVIFINHKRAGLYRSDGIAWGRLGTIQLAGTESPSPGYLPSNPPTGKYIVTNIYLDLEAKENVVEYNPRPKE